MGVHLQSFVDYLDQRNCSPHTLQAYTRDAQAFLEWGEFKRPALVRRKHLDEYLRKLKADGQSEKTICRKVSALSTYFKCLRYSGAMALNPCDGLELPKIPKRHTQPLTREEVEAMRRLPVITKRDDLDRLILELFYSTGARVSDLATAKRVDYDEKDGTIRVIGKGNKEAFLFLGGRARAMLDARLISSAMTSDSLLTDAKGRIGRSRIYNAIKRLAKKALPGKRVYPHLIRHSIITHRHDAGEDIRDLQKFARHENIATTAIYASVSLERQKEQHKKFDPDLMV